ncbi:unnamed protein product [Strongylus vulgaris]|uniref:G-protein coupled receptors family 1 profile domain-containing protein n=1 Tax=Strongylus vulgaris TaxID=40348 RepID=A0A3P7LG14_STRVU|nr:unnamed protein product [Strongylus vulgaris]
MIKRRPLQCHDLLPLCFPPAAFNTKSRIVWICSNVVISVLVIIVHIFAHINCRKHALANSIRGRITERNRRLLHSIFIVTGVYIFTWFATVVLLLITQMFHLSPATITKINLQIGWLVIINTSDNFFIYFWRAPDYR